MDTRMVGATDYMLMAGTIYIVDPAAADAAVVRSLVERLGSSGVVMQSAEELLERFSPADLPVAVVSEMNLPGMDGLALLAALKLRQINLPVIFLTRDSQLDRAVLALRAGARDYLPKPLVEQQLARRLRYTLPPH